MNRMKTLFAALALALALPAAQAQDAGWSAESILAAARQAPDLQYPAEASTLSFFSGPKMALYKPEGNGPFPALVLQHQCGGLRSPGNWQNMAMLDWARTALARGYVVLMVDSLGPRSVDTVCRGPKNGVNFMRGTRDALQAGAHLRTLPFVDKERIGFAGYSWGAMNAVLGSSKHWGGALGDGFRFRATVAFYPGCFRLTPATAAPFAIVNPDIDRPLLVLMGGQDTETPSAECVGQLEPAKAAGAPVSWHVYEQATHCWDCKNLHNFSKVDVRGNRVVYRFDEALLKDSAERMFDFLEKNMPRP